jgi:hypothetical protein
MMVSFFERRPAQDFCSATLDTAQLQLFHAFDTGKALDSVATRVYKKMQDTPTYLQP